MEVRIGIDSGEVVYAGPVSANASANFRVDGPPIHLASRLERLAAPGAAFLSGRTLRLVGDQIETKALGSRPIRGFTSAVDVYELALGRQTSAAAPLARRRHLAPLVGRDDAVGELAAVARQVHDGGLRVVGIRGEAGIGKSRLIAELCVRLQIEGFATQSVTARAYASHVPYGLVVDLVRALLRRCADTAKPSDEGDGPHASALADLLESGDPGALWRALTPQQRRQRIAEAVGWLVAERTRRGPWVIVVEDVFLADRDSLRLLESLAQRLRSQPLLLLLSYRQDFVHRWSDSPWFVEHWVGPLPSSQMEELAQVLLGADASLQGIRAGVLERADGNPFFLEQMVMTLVDDGSLRGPPGAYRSNLAEAQLRVPASIMAVIGARVDRLPSAAKASLEAAAIIGEPLDAVVIAPMQRIDPAEADGHLRQALSSGLITLAVPPANGCYVFRHALVQETVVAALTRPRRKQLHRAAFDALLLRGVDPASDSAAVLAHHAYNGENWLAAAECAQRAMSRSIARSANRDALRVFDLGLDAARRVEPEANMLPCELALRMEALGAQMALGQLDSIVSNLERAEAITRTLGDTRRQAAVSLQLAVSLWTRGSYRQGLEAAANAGSAASVAGSHSLQMAAIQARMMLNHGLGRYAEAEADATRVEREFVAELRARRLMPGWAVIAAVNVKAFRADVLICRGDLEPAGEACDAAYRELSSQDHAFSRVLTDFVYAGLLMAQQRADEAVALLGKALELCRLHDVPTMHPPVLARLGGALACCGEAAQALALLEPAIAGKAYLAGGRYNEHYFAFNLAMALWKADRIEEAVVAAHQAFDAAAMFEQRGHQAQSLLLLAQIEDSAGRLEAAGHHFDLARTAAQECQERWHPAKPAAANDTGQAAAATLPLASASASESAGRNDA